jgi:hypothetical protein
VESNAEFPLTLTAQKIYDWVLASAKQLDRPDTNYEITIEGE